MPGPLLVDELSSTHLLIVPLPSLNSLHYAKARPPLLLQPSSILSPLVHDKLILLGFGKTCDPIDYLFAIEETFGEICLLPKLGTPWDGVNSCQGKTHRFWPGWGSYCLSSVSDLKEEKDDAVLSLVTFLEETGADEAVNEIHQRDS